MQVQLLACLLQCSKQGASQTVLYCLCTACGYMCRVACNALWLVVLQIVDLTGYKQAIGDLQLCVTLAPGDLPKTWLCHSTVTLALFSMPTAVPVIIPLKFLYQV